MGAPSRGGRGDRLAGRWRRGVHTGWVGPLTFPEFLCLFSPLFDFILIDEPGGRRREGQRGCWPSADRFQKTAFHARGGPWSPICAAVPRRPALCHSCPALILCPLGP